MQSAYKFGARPAAAKAEEVPMPAKKKPGRTTAKSKSKPKLKQTMKKKATKKTTKKK